MPLLADERHREILRRLEAFGAARVTDLARDLEVTEETIRRDLERLDREGLLLRIHGGAVPIQRGRDVSFDVRRTANHEAKEAMARTALEHIAEGDVIAFDASSTVHELVRLLPDMNVTVVTNALPATVRLWGLSRVRVVSTGGMLDGPSRSWVGSFAELALERLNINKLFLSSKGVDLERGLSEVDDAQARVKRRMLDLAEQAYLLVDSSKLGGRSVVHLGSLDEIDVLITDDGVSAEWQAALRAANCTVEIASA